MLVVVSTCGEMVVVLVELPFPFPSSKYGKLDGGGVVVGCGAGGAAVGW
jgi:hypothetical protein